MNKQQQQADTDTPYCCFHPREVVVGVCAHCLKDRLHLLLAADPPPPPLRRRRTTSISLPKVVLALGSSFLQRLDSRHHHRTDDHDNYCSDDGTTSAASLDDSFISIKFEENGKATWDSNKVAVANTKAAAAVRSCSSSTVVVVEHGKRGGRWRKQVVGRLLQLARWKRSAAGHVHAGLDGNKAAGERSSKARSRGWLRSLTTSTRRRAGDRARS